MKVKTSFREAGFNHEKDDTIIASNQEAVSDDELLEDENEMSISDLN